MNDAEQEYMDAQEEQQMRSSAQQMGLHAAAEHKERTVHNEEFLNELRKADLDSEHFGWLEENYPDWFSGAHAVTSRPKGWAKSADLLMMNKRERAVAEGRPGRLLRDRPFALACMRGDESPQLDAYLEADIPGDEEYWRDRVVRMDTTRDPVTSEEKSRIYGAAEVAADLMALSEGGVGIESVSTVKTETSVRKQEEDESTASRVARVLE